MSEEKIETAPSVEEVPVFSPLGKYVIAILLIVIAVCAVSLFWYTQRAPSSPAPTPTSVEYKVYSKYGFSFEYPGDMAISEGGLLESTATDNSGMVSGELKNDKHELISIGWLTTVTADLDAGLEGGFTSMAKSEGVTSVERGELVETTKAGHRMIYQYFTITGGGEKPIWHLRSFLLQYQPEVLRVTSYVQRRRYLTGISEILRLIRLPLASVSG